MTRVLVTGSREILGDNKRAVIGFMLRSAYALLGPFTLVHGGATGADTIAAEYAARKNDITVEPPHLADWKTLGRRAGPIRNQRMVDLGADLAIAFLDECTSPRCQIPDLHLSHGATGCVDMIIAAGIPLWRIELIAFSSSQ